MILPAIPCSSSRTLPGMSRRTKTKSADKSGVNVPANAFMNWSSIPTPDNAPEMAQTPALTSTPKSGFMKISPTPHHRTGTGQVVRLIEPDPSGGCFTANTASAKSVK